MQKKNVQGVSLLYKMLPLILEAVVTGVTTGWNKLDQFVWDLCEEAGIEKTNHSLKVTGATRLYRSGVPEGTIQLWTEHKSTEALWVHVCEWPGEAKLADISNSVAEVSCTNSQPVVAHPLALGVGFGERCSQFAPPSLNISGCSVNVYTEPVVTSQKFPPF